MGLARPSSAWASLTRKSNLALHPKTTRVWQQLTVFLVISLFWAASTLISVATYRYYNFNGVLPGYETSRGPRTNSIDPDKAAFSTAPIDEEAYAPVGMNDQDDEPEFNASPYGGGMGTSSTRHDAHDINPYTADTSYGGAAAVHNPPFEHHSEYNTHTSPAPPGGHMYAPPPPAADDFDDRPVAFPSADYSRVQ